MNVRHTHTCLNTNTHALYLCVESLPIGPIHQARPAFIMTISIFVSDYRLPLSCNPKILNQVRKMTLVKVIHRGKRKTPCLAITNGISIRSKHKILT